ncbi:hypothetical protein PCE1_000163 [Barthelona sp. PCE]
MKLFFQNTEIARLGPIERNCAIAFPFNGKKCQKLVAGDIDGTVTCFSYRKQMFQQAWSKSFSSSVTSMCLSGIPGKKLDRAFVAMETDVFGIKKKGSVFYEFESGLSEDISNLHVSGVELVTAGEVALNFFEDECGSGFLIPGEDITAVAFTPPNSNNFRAFVACSDSSIQVIKNSDGVESRVFLEENVTALLFDDENDALYYGTRKGMFGKFNVRNTELVKVFEMKLKTTSFPVCLEQARFNLNDEYCVVGCDNGDVFVLGMDGNSYTTIYSENFSSSISKILVGKFTQLTLNEIALVMYSGKVVCLKPLEATEEEEKEEISLEESNIEVAKLKKIIGNLESKVTASADKFKELSKSGIATVQTVRVHSSFNIDSSNAVVNVFLEADVNVDYVAIVSDVQIEIVSAEGLDVVDGENTVLSRNQEDDQGVPVQLVYASPEHRSNLSFSFRVIEGASGNILCKVLGLSQPRSAALVKIPIKPLVLHTKISKNEYQTKYSGLDHHVLTIEGNFTDLDMKTWLADVISDFNIRNSNDKFFFENVFLQTFLKIDLEEEKATFCSNNCSIIAIVKEFVSTRATQSFIQIRPSVVLSMEAVRHVIGLLYPKMEKAVNVVSSVQLLPWIKEISMHIELDAKLPEKYQQVLDNEFELMVEEKQSRRDLDFLKGLLIDLFIDLWRLKGRYKIVQQHIEKFDAIINLNDFSFEILSQFFENPANVQLHE